MEFEKFLEHITSAKEYDGQLVHVEPIPEREAAFGEPDEEIPLEIRKALLSLGINRLYLHQADAVNLVRRRENVVVVTGTASGKTLCYNIPVIEKLLSDPEAKAVYLFPTKALAQDQMKGLGRLLSEDDRLRQAVMAGTYDGDTSPETRRSLRAEASIILSNPDMLHSGILPYHTRWNRFFSNLRFVVVDEIHTYRGIFGSNVANVLRRLRRVCNHYDADPQFICCSATIRNPKDLASRLTGTDVEVIDNDGSPRGRKHFAFWNPPYIDDLNVERRSSNDEGHRLMVDLIDYGAQVITFGRARIVAELIYRYVRDSLLSRRPEYADRVKPYRAGYLPQERREIEKLLFSGELRGVTSTNALELGIDVGSLDASVIVGYPGSIASTWQQAGRAGRKSDEALSIFIGYNDPIDQYLMRNPEYFFEQSPESAVIDPGNKYILSKHLRCAAFELPLTKNDEKYFGEKMWPITGLLEEFDEVRHLEDKWYWSTPDVPSRKVNLRTISDHTYTILDSLNDNAVLGVVDGISAVELVYPEAIYLHEGETYFVRDLDMEQKVAYVEKKEVDYYTQPLIDSSIRIREEKKRKPWLENAVMFGDATVTWVTSAFKKVRFYNIDSIGYCKLGLPPQHLDTASMWLMPARGHMDRIRKMGLNPVEGLVGIRNMCINVLPLHSMCDPRDIGGIVDSSNTGSPTMFLYDRYEGGLGFSERGYDIVEKLMEGCLEMVEGCDCESGCPSCVGLPVLIPAQHQDPDVGSGYPIPNKEAAKELLKLMLNNA